MKIPDLFKDNTILSAVELLTLFFSVGLNLFLTWERRKTKKIYLKRDIELKEIEMKETQDRHMSEIKELEANYEGDYRQNGTLRIDFRTENDKTRTANLLATQKREYHKLLVEWSHLKELNGEKTDILPLTNRGKIVFFLKYTLKRKLKIFFNSLKN